MQPILSNRLIVTCCSLFMMLLPLYTTGPITHTRTIPMPFSIHIIMKVLISTYTTMLTLVFGSTFDLAGQINDVCSFGTELSYVNPSILTVVGEFCGAQTDCNHLWRYG